MSNNHRSAAKGKLLFLLTDWTQMSPSGGQCVAVWALQALRQDWDVTILCAEQPDFAAANRNYGTCLKESDLQFVQMPWFLRQICRLESDPYGFQRTSWLMRKSRKIGGKYDMTIAFENEIDFGRQGIQYIHYPYLTKHRERIDDLRRLSPIGRLRAFFKGQYRPWMLVSGISFDRVLSNLTLVNSHWSAAVVERFYGFQPTTLYPPVHWSAPAVAWGERKCSFVSLGRISGEKRQIEVIDILERVRQRGYGVRLEIIGAIADPVYAGLLQKRAKAAGAWVQLHHGISRDELEKRVGACRYGLHTMRDEHFGIAVAELLRAGCIVFVPGNGGQVEIIGKEPALMYESDDQAVERICTVLANDDLQSRLRETLAASALEFTEEKFMHRLRGIVQEFARNRAQQQAS